MLRRIVHGKAYGGPQLSRQNQKRHGKTKNVTAKPKTSRQNQKPHGKNKIPHGKTENLTAKTKYLTTKPKPSRQNQRPHGKTKYFTAKTKYLTAKANTHGKTKAILFLLWSINLFLPWGFWFCRDVFVFAVRFLVLPWQLWATISTNLFVTKSLSENEILKSTSHTNCLHSPSNSFHYF